MVVGVVAGGRAKSKRWWAALVRRWCFSRRKKMKFGGKSLGAGKVIRLGLADSIFLHAPHN